MTQDVFFYRQKVLPEKISQLFSREEVYEAVKSLLAKKDLEKDSKLRKKLFEEVDLKLVQISAYSEEIDKLLTKEINFINQHSRFFMMNEKMWKAIKKEIFCLYSTIETNQTVKYKSDSNIDEQLNELCQQNNFLIMIEYKILEELYNKNLLFVNIQ
ncbi:hypothetical protein [Iningainema tapete]|uniref:Uncharacterized protein n=1 Tax=Iningainema tapete BLCC-T55 TaxID=2748662 RepID=A0A8J6XLK1_9CYAN|nr:hypothetical protein [Iningainema tapete]MBD2777008.1 hypothetical protein [Iningainema tapete BLCC-T55]